MTRRKRSRKSDAFLGLCLLALLLFVPLSMAIIGESQDGPSARVSDAGSPRPEASPPPRGAGGEVVVGRERILPIARGRDLRPLVGDRARASNVPVGDVVGPRAFWIGTPGNRLLVVLDDARDDLRPGTRVDLTGRIGPASAAPGAAAGAVREQGVVVRADRVAPSWEERTGRERR